MIHEQGDSGELEDNRAGMKFIAHNKDAISAKELGELMPKEEMDYITANAPKKGNDLDYNGFLDKLYKS